MNKEIDLSRQELKVISNLVWRWTNCVVALKCLKVVRSPRSNDELSVFELSKKMSSAMSSAFLSSEWLLWLVRLYNQNIWHTGETNFVDKKPKRLHMKMGEIVRTSTIGEYLQLDCFGNILHLKATTPSRNKNFVLSAKLKNVQMNAFLLRWRDRLFYPLSPHLFSPDTSPFKFLTGLRRKIFQHYWFSWGLFARLAMINTE